MNTWTMLWISNDGIKSLRLQNRKWLVLSETYSVGLRPQLIWCKRNKDIQSLAGNSEIRNLATFTIGHTQMSNKSRQRAIVTFSLKNMKGILKRIFKPLKTSARRCWVSLHVHIYVSIINILKSLILLLILPFLYVSHLVKHDNFWQTYWRIS